MRAASIITLLALFTDTQAQDDAPKLLAMSPFKWRLDSEGEWTNVTGDGGKRFGLKLTYWRHISVRRLFTIEGKLARTDLKGETTQTGLGDARIKYFWFDYKRDAPDKVYQGLAPIFDALLPTGDEDKGLGGGAVVLQPGVALYFKPSERWSIVPLFRYVVSLDDYFVGGNPESPIPSPEDDAQSRDGFFPGLEELANLIKVRGLNIESPFVYRPRNDRYLSFVALKAEIFTSTSSDNEGTTLTFKLALGKRLNRRSGISGELQLPVAGDTTFDSVIKVTGSFYF